MAEMLAIHTAEYGDPKKLFSIIEDLGKVNEDDVMRVAQRYFLPAGRHLFAISGNGALTVWEFAREPAHGKVLTITNVVLGLGRDAPGPPAMFREEEG